MFVSWSYIFGRGYATQTLHSIRTLLSTAMNATPHEQLFNYPHRSSSGCFVPIWLIIPVKVFLKRYVRQSKYDPIVEETELIEANPRYAHIRLQNSKEITVLLRNLAPAGLVPNYPPEIQDSELPTQNSETLHNE